MSNVKNFIGKADEMRGKIPRGYQMTAPQICELVKERPGTFDMVVTAFNFGYLQGIKAERARRKK